MHLSWEFLWGVGIAVLALAIAWGAWRNATRNRANDRVTEEATRREYEDPEKYQRRDRARLKQQLH